MCAQHPLLRDFGLQQIKRVPILLYRANAVVAWHCELKAVEPRWGAAVRLTVSAAEHCQAARARFLFWTGHVIAKCTSAGAVAHTAAWARGESRVSRSMDTKSGSMHALRERMAPHAIADCIIDELYCPDD